MPPTFIRTFRKTSKSKVSESGFREGKTVGVGKEIFINKCFPITIKTSFTFINHKSC